MLEGILQKINEQEWSDDPAICVSFAPAAEVESLTAVSSLSAVSVALLAPSASGMSPL